MNKIRFQLTCLIVAIAAMQASAFTNQVDTAKVVDAVRARSKAVSAAESAKDTQGAVAFYADDAIVQAPGAPQLQGRDAITALYSQLFADTTFKGISSTISNITVSQSGDLAYEIGINRMVYRSPKGDLLDIGKYLIVWKKIKGDWYISAIAFSSDAPAPVPMNASK
jgi:uncharacterized protein (TIGR02246 family)